jgi:hypothetical protein
MIQGVGPEFKPQYHKKKKRDVGFATVTLRSEPWGLLLAGASWPALGQRPQSNARLSDATNPLVGICSALQLIKRLCVWGGGSPTALRQTFWEAPELRASVSPAVKRVLASSEESLCDSG